MKEFSWVFERWDASPRRKSPLTAAEGAGGARRNRPGQWLVPGGSGRLGGLPQRGLLLQLPEMARPEGRRWLD